MTINQNNITRVRVQSIDILRGIVMIIMALDHARDYFHRDAFIFDPTDLTQTTPAIFFTRWITHFCAPVFVFLAGTSAFLSGQRKSKQLLSRFLLTRGLWLMLLEITVVCFGWFFNPSFSLQGLQVIWVLGLSMVVLSALVHLPRKAIFIFGILLIAFHNTLDTTHVPGNNFNAFIWSQLHEFNVFHYKNLTIFSAYPLIPWAGVMAVGYCFGSLYINYEPEKRRRFLLTAGMVGVLLFVAIRFMNVYGDPFRWSVQPNAVYSVLSFINTNKYPPSLLYLLMTLSPAMLLLALLENTQHRFTRIVSTYGRVPMFFYLLHIYFLHLLALLAASLSGYHWSDMIFTTTWITQEPKLRGYGFSLAIVYIVWLAVVVLLYPLCKRYDRYKQSHPEKKWLSYL